MKYKVFSKICDGKSEWIDSIMEFSSKKEAREYIQIEREYLSDINHNELIDFKIVSTTREQK